MRPAFKSSCFKHSSRPRGFEFPHAYISCETRRIHSAVMFIVCRYFFVSYLLLRRLYHGPCAPRLV